ncbi:MAG: TPM domain-containing protein [Myxococcota bacterium]
MVTPLLSDADRQRIESAIHSIEQKSSLELVVAVVGRSADYWQWRVLLAVCTGLSAGFAALEWAPIPPLWALVLQLPIGALAYLALGVSGLHRSLIPERASLAAVQAYAFRLFAERGLHHTHEHTGLLILVSALERRVVILGDSGLHARIGESGWSEYVAHLVQRLREGRAAEGILEVIARVEAKLAAEFPRRTDDADELPNAVIVHP